MEIQILAIKYFELKEKALIERSHIDYDMKAQLKALEKDKTSAGKANLEHYNKEINAMEEVFNNTISEIQPVFEELYPYLEQTGATKANPHIIKSTDYTLEMYLDNNKNIHYLKNKS
ncbi:MAG: hypothetical protein EOO07_09115 [Chitinophagaceae bacterium]|nr:MAG: hypothetical protein EOO07_09115 [Chitinophagaceae bacterium]